MFDAAQADDLTQTALERALTHWHQFDQQRDILVRLLSIAHNAHRDGRRRDGRMLATDPAELQREHDRQGGHAGPDAGLQIDRLSAWLDGELDPAGTARVEAWLHDHPEDAARVPRWRADRDRLRERLAPMLDEPLPESLRQGVERAPSTAAVNTTAWRRLAMLAGLMLGSGAVGAAPMWQAQRSVPMAAASPSADGDWVQRASVAHAVYAPELRHPVDVDTRLGTEADQRAQEAHLSRWLTQRLAMPVKLFDLRAMGFELVGGRLLPYSTAPSAQLLYQSGSGQRVTVYLRKPEASAPAAFRYGAQGELGLFYWIAGPTGYALVGPLPRTQLLALAESIFRQGRADAAGPDRCR